ncbi:MAG: galactokinase [Chitinophagales bacterium]|nr:galactokinase [Chitinophagales bacterium]
MIERTTLQAEFFNQFKSYDFEAYFSPGRVNLIGEHIDYNGGYVLPIAISLGITALVAKNNSDTIRIYSKDMDEEFSFSINELFRFNKPKNSHWSDYVKASLQVLKDSGVQLFGAYIYLASDLPLGAGLSSSAALECLMLFIFNESYYSMHREQLAIDAQKAERAYVGVNCGIMDQYAVANGKQNHAMLLNCATLECQFIPANFGAYQLVIMNSNKPRALAASKYNERRDECERAFSILKKFDIATNLCNVHVISLAYLADDILYQRAKHAILENQRVLNVVNALEKNELEIVGQLLTESHISLDTDYEVSSHELNMLVHFSTHFEGCIGARMTGAGFGGCCIALVEKNRIDKFISYVGKKYTEKTSLKAEFYTVEMVDGVQKMA